MRARSRRHDGFSTLSLPRGTLLGTTALQAAFALVFALPALAQPAPNARPQGGQVVAGQASIARSPGATTITQSTDRAAIDWQSFDVGAQQRVVFQQPGAGSVTLNRVITPRPSEIAGRIEANGSVVIINGAGVVFHRGAQVEAQSFVASTADTTNAAFMAGGRLRLDQPGRPGARIENRGNITVRDTGLAALVAPGVANSGTIRARMGTVVLGGAETHTIDLHGDGLVAFDITGQVRTAPGGGVALVTNTGTVQAEGGTVLLSASAADGLVQDLVTAGGTIRADSLGARTGTVEIAGIGGAVRVEGMVSAAGTRPGETGGTVVARATGDVALGPTARVVASGPAGGGTVAIGTTAARARAQGGGVGPENARRTRVAAGAEIAADATERGHGGTVAVIGRERVDHAGAITARGGPQGGDGGRVEVSSNGGFGLSGRVDTSASAGAAGTLLIDPVNLKIVSSLSKGQQEQDLNPAEPQIKAGDGAKGGGDDAFILAATVEDLLQLSNVRLEASNDIFVQGAITKNSGNSLTLAAGNNITVSEAITVSGGISLFASSPRIAGATDGGIVTVNAKLEANAGSIAIVAFGKNGQISFGNVKATASNTLTLAASAMKLPVGTKDGNKLSGATVEITSVGGAMTLGSGGSGLNFVSVTPATGEFANLKAVNATTLLRLGGSATVFESTPMVTEPPASTGLTLVGDLALNNVALDLRSAGGVANTAGTLSGVTALTGLAATGNFKLDSATHDVATIGQIKAEQGVIALKLKDDRTFNQAFSDNLVTTKGIHVEAASFDSGGVQKGGALTIAGTIERAGEIALTGATVQVNDAAVLRSTDAAVVLRSTKVDGALKLGSTAGGAVTVKAATRITIRSDGYDRNTNTLKTTGPNGVVELATESLRGFEPLQDLSGTYTDTYRIGAATSPLSTTVEVTATSIDLKVAAIPAGGFTVLDLRSTGAVTQTGGGIDLTSGGATARSLAGVAESFTLTSEFNTIPTLGALKATGGGIAIATKGTLTVAGAVSATAGVELGALANPLTDAIVVAGTGSVAGTTIALKAGAGGITLKGGATQSGTGGTDALTITTEGAVTGDGAVSANRLTGSAASVALGGATPATTAVKIGALGDFTAGAGFKIVSKGDMQVTGAVKAAQAADGSLSLAAATVTVAEGAALTAGTATKAGGISLLSDGNVTLKGDLRAFAVGGLEGNISIQAGAAGSIAQSAGTVRADATLSLTGAAGITQSGTGILDAATLLGTASAGAIALPNANRLDRLGSLDARDGITLTNGIALQVTGPVSAGTSGSGLATLRITSGGAMEVTGALTAGKDGVRGGNIVLTANDGTLRDASPSAGDLTIKGAGLLNARRFGTEGGEASLTAAEVVAVLGAQTAPDNGRFAVSAGTFKLGTDGALIVKGTGGAIQVIADDILLGGGAVPGLSAPDGQVTIAPRTDGRGIALGAANGTDLVLDTTGIEAKTLQVGLVTKTFSTGDITVQADFVFKGETLRFESGGAIGGGGVLTATRLEGSAAGDITLDAVAHKVGTLGDLASGGALRFKAAGALTVAGEVTAADDLFLTATSLTVNGRADSATKIASLTATTGAIDVTGTVQAGTDALLDAAGNIAVAATGRVDADGNAVLTSGLDLTVAAGGQVTAGGTATLGAGGTISIGGLVDAGANAALTAGPLIAVLAGGEVTAGGNASLGAGTINVAGGVGAGGAATLTASSAIGVSGSVTAGTDAVLDGGAATDITGKVQADRDVLLAAAALKIGAAGEVLGGANRTVTLRANAMTLAGAVKTAGGQIEIIPLTPGLGITLAGSGIGTLDISADSLLNLSAARLLIGARDGGAQFVTGDAVAGDVTVAGAAKLDGIGRLRFRVKGDVTDAPGGSLEVATLGDVGLPTLSNANSIVLDSAANRIFTLGSLKTAQQIEITSAAAMQVAADQELRAGSTIALRGAATAAEALSVAAGARLDARAGGLTLETANGGLGLAAGSILKATGGDIRLVVKAEATATLDGTVTALQDAVPAGGGLLLSGGTFKGNGAITATTLGTDTKIAALDLSGTANAIGKLGAVTTTTGGIALRTEGDLSLTGAVVSAGDVSLAARSLAQDAGTALKAAGFTVKLVTTADADPLTAHDIALNGQIIAGRLTGTSAGALTATTATNEIAAIGNLAAASSIAVLSRTAVTVDGTVAAPDSVAITGTAAVGNALSVSGSLAAAGAVGSVALTATAGGITLSGGVSGTVVASVSAAGSVEQAAGTVSGGTASVTAGAAVTQAAGATISGGTVSVRANGGNLSLSGTVKATTGAELTTGAAAPLIGVPVAGRDVIVANGAQVDAGGTLTVTSIGRVVAPGLVNAALLTGEAAGTAAFGNAANKIGELGGFTAAGSLTLRTTPALKVSGPVAVTKAVAPGDRPAITLITAGALDLAANVTTTDLALTATGIAQSAGRVAADNLVAKATAGGITLKRPANEIGALGSVTATADVAIVSATGIAVNGPVVGPDGVSISAPDVTVNGDVTGGTVGLTATAGDVTQEGASSISATGGAATLTASGAIALKGALSGTGVTLRADGGGITQEGGSIAAGTGVADLRASAGISLKGGTLSASDLVLKANGGGITLTDAEVAWIALADVQASGAIAQTGGRLDGGSDGQLRLGAGTSISLTSAANIVPKLGETTAADGIALATAGDMRVVGPVNAGAAGALLLDIGGGLTLDAVRIEGGTATLNAGLKLTNAGIVQAKGGELAFTGLVTLDTRGAVAPFRTGGIELNGSLAAGSATLTSGGALTQGTDGVIALKGPLALTAVGDATLNGSVSATSGVLTAAALRQAGGGTMAFSGPLTLESSGDMMLDGRVGASELTLLVGGNLTQAAATGVIAGPGGAPELLEALRLKVTGDATFGGRVDARLLTHAGVPFGSDVPVAVGGELVMQFETKADGNRVLALGDLKLGERFELVTQSALRIDGLLHAPIIRVTASGDIDFGTVLLRTGGKDFVPAPPGGLPQARMPDFAPTDRGAVFETRGQRIRISRTSLDIQPVETRNATVAFRLPEQSAGRLIDLGSTTGRAADLILDLGLGGRFDGTVDVRNVTFYGSGGGGNLEGSIGGVSGQAAASRAGIGPQLSAAYQINGCPVASVNCVLLVVRLATPANPVQDLGLTAARDEREDPDIFVPNVAERDF